MNSLTHFAAPGSGPANATRVASVSVIIPACRATHYILSTLGAVARQSVRPLEVLVFEDGHFDDTAAKVRLFASGAPFATRLFGSPANIGVSRARNHLLRESRGEFIAFLDADDIWQPNHLETALAGFATGADVCFSGVTFIDPTDRALPGRAEPTPADLANIAASVFDYNFVQCTSTLSLRRSWITRTGDFDPALSHGEDLDLWLRLLAAGARFRYTGHCSCCYRKHPTSAMADTPRMVERMGDFYEKQLRNPILPRRQRRAALIHNRQIHARLQWQRHPAKSAAAFARLARLQPWNPLHAAAWLLARLRAGFTA